MLCEHYKDALIDAAASGAALSAELRAHLAGCASCRAAFVQEQSLFAAIDSGLHSAANAEVPTSLLPRVRASLVREPSPHVSWVTAWGYAALTAAALIAMLAGLLVFRNGRHGPRRNEIASNHAEHELSSPEAAAPLRENSVKTPVKPTAIRRGRPKTAKPTLTAKKPMVLVPIGQEQAVARLIDDLRRGGIKGEVLLASRSLQSQDLSIAPLEVSPIEVKALESAQPERH